jgi:ubiquinone biosynthesis protein
MNPTGKPDSVQPGSSLFPNPYRGVVGRFFVLLHHLLGLLAGGVVAKVRALPPEQKRSLRHAGLRLAAGVFGHCLDPDIARLSFPEQLRRRLELAGPTYVKFGQIMAVREDMLPKIITDELKNLFEHLPEIPFPQIRAIIERGLQQRLEDIFRCVAERPLGSASIAQAHLAELNGGERVVIKVIKPGIRELIMAELRLLSMLGRLLQRIIPQYQPQQMVEEFSAYTGREIDFTFEADNGEIFAQNFRDLPDVVFPKMYRELSTVNVLTMDYLDGFQPGDPKTLELSLEERDRIVDLGAEAILRMLYQHGFFHADLHAGNLMILPGDPIRIGFIDLGMVGRFEEETRLRMLYYFHALVNGDIVGATRYLSALASVEEGSDSQGFRRAVTDLSRRFVMHSAKGEFSVARLILQSIGLGARYRMFFRVELLLMVKALITFEGVGRMLDSHLDVVAVTQEHMQRIFLEHYYPTEVTRELLRHTLRATPEVIDFLTQLPELLSEKLHSLQEPEPPPRRPMVRIRSSILAAACLISGVLAVLGGGPFLLWMALFLLAFLLYFFGA